jgi:N-acetylneuraminic acid mutarotase
MKKIVLPPLIRDLSVFLLIWVSSITTAYPQTGVWTTLYLNQGRFYLASAAVKGKVIFAGGIYNGLVPVATVNIYDTESKTWSTAELSKPRGFLAAAVNGNKAYFAGGGDFEGAVTNKIDVYDAESGEWSTMTLSQPRMGLSAASVGNKVIFAGGGALYFPQLLSPSKLIEIYDVTTGTWEYNNLTVARASIGVAVADGKVFFGGGNKGGAPTNVVDILDVESNTITTTTLSKAREFITTAAVGDKVIFAGGITLSGEEFSEIDIYDAQSGTWEPTTYLPQKKGMMTASVIGNKAYFAGGGINSNGTIVEAFNTVHIYDAMNNNWQEDHFTVKRASATSCVWDKSMYIAGGYNPAQGLTTWVEVFTDTTTQISPVQQVMNEKTFDVFPNPASSFITLRLPELFPLSQNMEVLIYDLTGRIQLNVILQASESSIDIGSIHPGMYLLEVRSGRERVCKNILIQ